MLRTMAAMAVLAFVPVCVSGQDLAGQEIRLRLKFSPRNDLWAMRETGTLLVLATDKPVGVTREPAYRAQPLYGSFALGNGAQQSYTVVVDEVDAAQSFLYVDANRNGDLTDDAAVAWGRREPVNIGDETKTEFTAALELEGVWGAQANIHHRCPLEFSKIQGRGNLSVANRAAWVGEIQVGNAMRAVALTEAALDRGAGAAPARLSSPKHGPLFMADLNGDRMYRTAQSGGVNEIWALNEVIVLGARRYTIQPYDTPSELTLVPTAREAVAAEPSPVLLPVGSLAPDFTVEGWQTGPLKLSDFRGKVVILDFWATWCSACKATMPYLEKLYESTREQGVVVLSVCTGDTPEKYAAWVPTRMDRYAFKFAFDAGERVGKQYDARFLPTKYIIGRDGRIVAAFYGGGGPDQRIDRALERAGIRPNNNSGR